MGLVTERTPETVRAGTHGAAPEASTEGDSPSLVGTLWLQTRPVTDNWVKHGAMFSKEQSLALPKRPLRLQEETGASRQAGLWGSVSAARLGRGCF